MWILKSQVDSNLFHTPHRGLEPFFFVFRCFGYYFLFSPQGSCFGSCSKYFKNFNFKTSSLRFVRLELYIKCKFRGFHRVSILYFFFQIKILVPSIWKVPVPEPVFFFATVPVPVSRTTYTCNRPRSNTRFTVRKCKVYVAVYIVLITLYTDHIDTIAAYYDNTQHDMIVRRSVPLL